MTAAVDQAVAQLHRDAVRVTCPAGHSTSTQAASGQRIRCGGCLAETGETVLVEVPARPDKRPRPARPPARPPGQVSPPQHRDAVCRSCGRTGPGSLPIGWFAVTTGADPATTRNGRPYRWYGTYCSPACAVTALNRAGVRPGPPGEPGRGELARLMSERPRGRGA